MQNVLTTTRINLALHKFYIKRAWKELRKNRKYQLINLALVVAVLLFIITDQKYIFFHLTFLILIYGAFIWSLLSFVYHAGFWIPVITIAMLLAVNNGVSTVSDLIDLLFLTLIVFVVFGLARKRTIAEKGRQASETSYRRLVELTFESVFIVVDEKIASVNSHAIKLFKAADGEELIGKPIREFLHPSGFERFKLLTQSAIDSNGELGLFEEQLVRLDNTYVDIEAVGLVITYREKQGIQFILRDITERKQAEEVIRLSIAKFQGLVETAPDVIIFCEQNGVITLVNAQAERMFGYKCEELIGNSIDLLFPDRLWEKHYLHRTNSQSSPQPLEMGAGLSLVGRHRDGYEFPINVKLSPVFTEKGLNFMTIIRDINDREQAEQHIIHAARLVALGQMSAVLAHELNNPLQIIKGYLELILDFPLEPGEKESYLQTIRQQIDRLHDGCWRVLDYARLKQEPRKPVALADLLRQVLTLADKQRQQSGIRIVLDFQDVPQVLVVPGLVFQVFLNLVINALESANKKNDDHLRIELKSEEGLVKVSFTTYGATIPSNDLPHIFEPFYTTKPDSSGLGLWISRYLVGKNKGTLDAKNLLNGLGVVFTVKFPPVTTI